MAYNVTKARHSWTGFAIAPFGVLAPEEVCVGCESEEEYRRAHKIADDIEVVGVRVECLAEVHADDYPAGKVCAEPGCGKPVKLVPAEHTGTRALAFCEVHAE